MDAFPEAVGACVQFAAVAESGCLLDSLVVVLARVPGDRKLRCGWSCRERESAGTEGGCSAWGDRLDANPVRTVTA